MDSKRPWIGGRKSLYALNLWEIVWASSPSAPWRLERSGRENWFGKTKARTRAEAQRRREAMLREERAT